MRLFDYAPSANCLKVRVAARLLDIELERVPVDIFAGETLTPEFARMNPMRVVPVLELEPDRFLPESGAILLFLAEGSRLLPAGSADRADVSRWLFFERAFTPAVGGLRFVRLTGREEQMPAPVVEDMRSTGARLLKVLDRHLADREFVSSGALTVADLALYAYAHVAEEGGFDLAPHEHLRRWLDTVAATPGFVNDLEPYPESSRLGVSRSIYG